MLIHQKRYLDETYGDGLVDDAEFNQLTSEVNERLVTTENYLFDWEVPNIDSIVMKFPVFSMLQPE